MWSKMLQGQITAKNQAKEMEETVPETMPVLAIVVSCPDCIWEHLPSPQPSYLHRPPFVSLLINLHQAAVTGFGPRSALIPDPPPAQACILSFSKILLLSISVFTAT